MILENIDRKPTKAERVAEAELEASLLRVRMYRHEVDLNTRKVFRETFPDDWCSLEDKYPDRPKRTRITARFDEDVVKFFKRSGAGYQAKMNEVLRMYMFARVAKYVEANGERDRHGDLF
ncbi:MAG: BrnA antitoxin family protein [Rhodobacteraceae bacterium]|nr:BrnA antitoxin family protein [Paracoccaceae bacterium]